MQTRSTAWALADLSANVSKTIWEITEAYRRKYQGEKIRHGNSHPTQLLRYFRALYLTMGRPQEPMKEPFEVVLANHGAEIWIEVTKVNEKHFSKAIPHPDAKPIAGNGYHRRRPRLDLQRSERDVIVQAIPVFNEWEQKMWISVTDGGLYTKGRDMFRFHEWKSITPDAIHHIVRANFKADLRDINGKVHKDMGITPYILRHMRAYNLIVNYGADVQWVVKMGGWNNPNMLYRYADIRRNLGIKGQLEILRRNNMLTNLAVDISGSMPG